MNKKFAFAFALLALMTEPGLSDTAPAPSKITRVYDILRNGSKIGTDIVEIDKQGEVTTVKFTTHISVKLAFIEAYHFEHSASETWKGLQFASFKSQTDDNGTKHNVSATAAGDKVRLDVDGKANEIPRKVVPASFWSKSLLTSGEMFDESDGKVMSVKVSDLGEETLTLEGAPRRTRHYRIVGGLERDLWFDGDILVRLRLAGTDGSKIVSDLRP